jgi:hypothetical protein
VLSANTRDHLSVLGFDAAEIDQLRAEGVI